MDNETKDILMMLLEKVDNIDKNNRNEFNEIKDRLTKLELTNENNIKPTLQAILENQTEVINQKSKITEVEGKHDKLKDRVDVIEYAVKENQNEIEKLKKRA